MIIEIEIAIKKEDLPENACTLFLTEDGRITVIKNTSNGKRYQSVLSIKPCVNSTMIVTSMDRLFPIEDITKIKATIEIYG